MQDRPTKQRERASTGRGSAAGPATLAATVSLRGKTRRLARLLAVLSLVGLLQGCAAYFAAMAVAEIAAGVTVAVSPDLEPLPKTETHRASLAYPIATLYATLQHTAAQNGRAVVETIDESHSLRVSYPFSLFTNNWGGVITISCIGEDPGTTIVFLGSGRDTNQRLLKIDDEILHDLRDALALQSAAH